MNSKTHHFEKEKYPFIKKEQIKSDISYSADQLVIYWPEEVNEALNKSLENELIKSAREQEWADQVLKYRFQILKQCLSDNGFIFITEEEFMSFMKERCKIQYFENSEETHFMLDGITLAKWGNTYHSIKIERCKKNIEVRMMHPDIECFKRIL